MENYYWLVILLVFVFVLHTFRQWALHRRIPAKNHEEFAGQVFQVAKCTIAYQKAISENSPTIVAMHGWLEDHRYFTKLYQATDGELIFINSCDYHLANRVVKPEAVEWATHPLFDEGSIEYDAAVLVQAVKNLASSKDLILHGHSRGGAVVLEAIKQEPALFENAKVVLEAAILPEASLAKGIDLPQWLARTQLYLTFYFFPFLVLMLARFGLPAQALKTMGPKSKRKTYLLKDLFSAPTTPKVLMNNISSMQRWPLENKVNLFDKVKKGYFVIGSSDNILSRTKMIKSAERNNGNMEIIKTKNSSHFVTLDMPDFIRELLDLDVAKSA